MPETYILAHDLGTSGDKATLFTTQGDFVATKTTAYPKFSLANGGVEQDPEDWWKAFCLSTKDLVASVRAENIAVVGFDGTFPNCLCLDAGGAPLTRAFIWQDTRAAEEAAELTETLPADVLSAFATGQIDSDKTLAKLLWIKRHEPHVFERIAMVFPTSQDYIAYKLTGEMTTEISAGRGTRMLNSESTDWSDELLLLLGMDRDQMPRLVAKTDVVGTVQAAVADECGLATGTPVVIGTGDAYAAFVGAGMFDVGNAFLTGGTSGGIYALASDGEGGTLKIGGETSASGAALAWLKDVVCTHEQVVAEKLGRNVFDLLNEEADESPIGSHGLMFHPHLAGERYPRHNAMAQGSFVGLSLTTTRSDMIRAVMEGIALNMGVILDGIREQGVDPKRMLIVGGLGQGEVARQIFADVMNVEFEVPRYPAEVATMGTAILAGIGAGIFEDERSAHALFHDVVSTTKPIPENVARYAEIKPVFEAVYKSLEPVYPHIYNIRRWLGDE